jgi:hypothetical protein
MLYIGEGYNKMLLVLNPRVVIPASHWANPGALPGS